jgi:hypothetical protein
MIFQVSQTHTRVWDWYSSSSSLDLVGFFMLILRVVGLIEKTLLVHVVFLDLLFFASLPKNNILLLKPPQRLSMQLLLPNPMDCAHHERLWSDL